MPKTLNNIHKRIERDKKVENNSELSGKVIKGGDEAGLSRKVLRQRIKNKRLTSRGLRKRLFGQSKGAHKPKVR